MKIFFKFSSFNFEKLETFFLKKINLLLEFILKKSTNLLKLKIILNKFDLK